MNRKICCMFWAFKTKGHLGLLSRVRQLLPQSVRLALAARKTEAGQSLRINWWTLGPLSLKLDTVF